MLLLHHCPWGWLGHGRSAKKDREINIQESSIYSWNLSTVGRPFVKTVKLFFLNRQWSYVPKICRHYEKNYRHQNTMNTIDHKLLDTIQQFTDNKWQPVNSPNITLKRQYESNCSIDKTSVTRSIPYTLCNFLKCTTKALFVRFAEIVTTNMTLKCGGGTWNIWTRYHFRYDILFWIITTLENNWSRTSRNPRENFFRIPHYHRLIGYHRFTAILVRYRNSRDLSNALIVDSDTPCRYSRCHYRWESDCISTMQPDQTTFRVPFTCSNSSDVHTPEATSKWIANL